MSGLPVIPPPAAPPIAPGPMGLPAPVWPRVLGIIAIVLGALGALSNLWGIGAGLLIALGIFPAGPGNWPLHWGWWMVLGPVVWFLLAILLLIAGIGLLKQRRWSVRAALTWAVLRLIWGLVAAGVTIPMMHEQFQSTTAQAPSLPKGAFVAMIGASVFVTLVWDLAPAGFALIWFTRSKVRAQTADWS